MGLVADPHRVRTSLEAKKGLAIHMEFQETVNLPCYLWVCYTLSLLQLRSKWY